MAYQFMSQQSQVKKYQTITVVASLILTVDCQRDGAFVSCIIGSPIVVDADLGTILPVWTTLSFHRLSLSSISAGRGGEHMLKPYLSITGWMIFFVVARICPSVCRSGHRGSEAYSLLGGIIPSQSIG